MSTRTLAPLAAGLPLLLALACDDAGFDSPTELRDLRILAVKAEPPEIKLPVRYLFAPPEQRPEDWPLPGFQVEIEVYAFDPREGRVTTSVFMCPEDYNDPSCLSFSSDDLIPAGMQASQRAELEAVYQPRLRGNTLADAAMNPAVPIGDNRFSFKFSTPVIDSLLWQGGGDPWGLILAPLLPRFVVEVYNSEVEELREERAFKRFPISLDFNDPELPSELLEFISEFFGAPPCESPPADDDPFVEGIASCFYDRGANSNPVLAGFDLVDPYAEAEARAEGMDIPAVRFSASPQLGPRPVLLVEPGATVHLRPVFKPGSMERYQVFVLAPFVEAFALEDRYEDFVCFWYVTGGELGAEPGQGNVTTSTAREGGEAGLDMDWVVAGGSDDTGPAIGRDTLVLVVHDQPVHRPDPGQRRRDGARDAAALWRPHPPVPARASPVPVRPRGRCPLRTGGLGTHTAHQRSALWRL